MPSLYFAELGDIATHLGISTADSRAPLALLTSILDRISDSPDLCRRYTPHLTFAYAETRPTGAATRQELALLRRLLDSWNLIEFDHLLVRSIGAGQHVISEHVRHIDGALQAFEIFLELVGKRLSIKQTRARTPRLLRPMTGDGESDHIFTEEYTLFVERVLRWTRDSSTHQASWVDRLPYLREKRLLLEDYLLLRIRLIQIKSRVFQELHGLASCLITSDINLLLYVIVPAIKPKMNRATAEVLSLLNEIALEPLAAYVDSHGEVGSCDAGRARFATLERGLGLEQGIWGQLGKLERELAAEACLCAISVEFSRGLTRSDARESVARHLLRVIREEERPPPLEDLPLTSLLAVEEFCAGARTRLGKSPEPGQASVASIEAIPKQLCGLLLRYETNPEALRLDVPYRSLVRAKFVGDPPTAVWIDHLAATNRLPEAGQCLAEWLAREPELVLRGLTPDEGEEGRASWRDELGHAAMEAIETSEGSAFSANPPEELARQLPTQDMTPRVTNAQEIIYNSKKLALFDHYSIHLERTDGDGRAALDSLAPILSAARATSTDLLFVDFSRVGVRGLHFDSQDEKWRTASGLSTVTRRLALAILAEEWRIMNSPYLVAAALMESADREDTRTGILAVSNAIAAFLAESLSFKRRTAMILGSGLGSFPILPALVRELKASTGFAIPIGELDPSAVRHHEDMASTDGEPAACHLFVSPELSSQKIPWELRLGQGALPVSDFGVEDVLSALSMRKSIVHIVAHGIFDKDLPLFSYLKTPRGPVFVLDLLNHRFKAELLLLSSCSGGSGGTFGALKTLSPLRSAVARGVAVGVGNLFPVSSDLSAQFASSFQEALLAKRVDVATAFAVALLGSGKDGGVPSFTLVGRSLQALFSPPPFLSVRRPAIGSRPPP